MNFDNRDSDYLNRDERRDAPRDAPQSEDYYEVPALGGGNRYQRRHPLRFPVVSFNLDGFDAPVRLPDIGALTVRVQRAITRGDLDQLMAFFDTFDTSGDTSALVDGLTDSEFMQLMERWDAASSADRSKSS